MTSSAPERVTWGKRKSSNQYYFVVKGYRIRVCKKYFLNTLDISEKTVYYTLKKNSSDCGQAQDMRGKQKSTNATSFETIDHVKQHRKFSSYGFPFLSEK